MVAEELGVQGQPATRSNHIKWKYVILRTTNTGGWGIAQYLKSLLHRHKFDLWHPHSLGWWYAPVIPVLGRQRQKDPWGSLANPA